jgi:hypothetical protein
MTRIPKYTWSLGRSPPPRAQTNPPKSARGKGVHPFPGPEEGGSEGVALDAYDGGKGERKKEGGKGGGGESFWQNKNNSESKHKPDLQCIPPPALSLSLSPPPPPLSPHLGHQAEVLSGLLPPHDGHFRSLCGPVLLCREARRDVAENPVCVLHRTILAPGIIP